MAKNEMTFVRGLPKMALDPARVRLPFTRRQVDWTDNPPFRSARYRSLFELTAESGKMMAENALDDLMSGGAARTHGGQTSAGLVASGLSASTLRLPEINTGSLVAISL